MTNAVSSPRISAIRLPAGLATPALVIDVDRMDRNIRSMADAVASRGIALRPHVKTHKSVAVARRQLDAGAAGLTGGTVGEAEGLAGAGFDNLFIAYPVFADRGRGARVRALHEAVHLRVGVDSVQGVRALGAALAGSHRPLAVLIEVDSGERRTGVAAPADAIPVALAARDAGLDVIGVFTHGGHGYTDTGAAPGAARDEVDCLGAAALALASAGFEVRERSAGSTPTALITPAGTVTELRPGTYVYGDRQQVLLGAIEADAVAIAIAATVVSIAQPGWVALDAGAKILAREPRPDLPGLASVPDLGDAPILRAFDYHGLARLPDGIKAPPVGTVLAVIPNHACPVVNLVDEVTFVVDGRVVETAPVDARGRNG